jgi:hypothetical protein
MAAMRSMAESPSLAHTQHVGTSVSLGSSATFLDGVLFALLLAILTALLWRIPLAKLREPVTLFTAVLAFATAVLAFVAILQWRTLDQQARIMDRTDETFRAGERAFVFLKLPGDGWQKAQINNGVTMRALPVTWENSGNSPTRDLVIKLYCVPPQPNAVKNPITVFGEPPLGVRLLLGPKQTTWVGTCNYTAAALDLVKDKGYHLYIAAAADYFDIFDAPHKTEACFEVINLTGTTTGSFEDVNIILQWQFTTSCGRNCTDEECKNP